MIIYYQDDYILPEQTLSFLLATFCQLIKQLGTNNNKTAYYLS